MSGPSAEIAYLFRHALLRDAAYEMQLPGDRARLHALAIDAVEALHGTLPDQPDDEAGYPLDRLSADLANHARAIAQVNGADAGARRREARYLRRAAIHAMREYRREDEQAAWTRLAGIETGSARANALTAAALVATELPGLADQAQRLIADALKEANGAGDNAARGKALAVHAKLQRRAGRPDDAGRALSEALDALRKAGMRRETASLLNDAASMLMDAGRVGEAEARFHEAAALAESVGDFGLQGAILGNRATLLVHTGKRQEGHALGLAALDLLGRAGLRAQEGAALGNLATELHQAGETAEARRLYEQAMGIHVECGNLRSQGLACLNLGMLHWELAQAAQAGQMLNRALDLFRTLGEDRLAAAALRSLALVEAGLGRLDTADALARTAVSMFHAHRSFRGEAIARCYYACVLLMRREVERAQHEWEAGVSSLRELGDDREIENLRAMLTDNCRRAGFSPPLQT